VAFALMSKYYGFTVKEINNMTLYQFESYMENIHTYEKMANGEQADTAADDINRDSIDAVASRYGINIPGV
jgi:hypothetical protein